MRTQERAEPSTHSTVTVPPMPLTISTKMRTREYRDVLKVYDLDPVVGTLSVLSKSLTVTPSTRRPPVEPSTRACAEVEESAIVTSDPAAFTPTGSATTSSAT